MDFERAAIKDEKDTICRHLLIVWEHLLYYSSRLVQILFQDVTSGNFEVFFHGNESVVQKLSPFNTQESDTTDITDQIKDLFSCEMLHSWFNS